MKKSLENSDWLLVASFLALFICCFGVAKINSFRAGAAAFENEVEEFCPPGELRVVVLGEVASPGFVVLPSGARICDLKSKVVLKEGADKSFFKRRRLLKNGEIIEVPKKSIE